MKKFKKVFVGKGKTNKRNKSVRVTMKLSELVKLAYEFNNQSLVTVNVSKMKNADPYQRTHTVYASLQKENTYASLQEAFADWKTE